MIVRITSHPRQKAIVLVHTPPDLAHAMGLFQPARWSPESGAYLLGAEHLDAFARHLGRHDAYLVDERGAAKGAEEKFTGPLPECSACGQPASRSASLAMTRCPACGVVWRPAVAAGPSGVPPAVAGTCAACGRSQQGRFPFCSRCGAAMPEPGPSGPRPAHVARPKLDEPALFGDVVEEVAAELDPARDHMQRAAGDR